jgi:hypothetical protein
MITIYRLEITLSKALSKAFECMIGMIKRRQSIRIVENKWVVLDVGVEVGAVFEVEVISVNSFDDSSPKKLITAFLLLVVV